MTRVAVIGAGKWGRNLVRTFDRLGALACVVENSQKIQEEIGTLFPGVPIFSSLETVWTSDIPAVVIATPVPTHFAIAKAALLAGKDVFVEKPITMQVEEAEELFQIATRLKRVLMVGHLLLYQPAIRWMEDYIKSGELGCIHSLHQRRAQLGRVRQFENVLWSLGVHDIAVMLRLIGEAPKHMMVHGQRVLQQAIEDDVHLHMSFASGISAHLHVSWLWPQQERKLVVIGKRGMLVYDETEQEVTLHRKGIRSDLSKHDDGAEVVFSGSDEPLKLEALHFLTCISERAVPLSDGANGVAVISVLSQATELLLKRGRDDE
ncbi:UNVERIFIED_CONTAM: putative dehydrogenase [Brevibacillus sp. OAP136]